jgi:RNA polymerase sigma factor (sigma-70 family)
MPELASSPPGLERPPCLRGVRVAAFGARRRGRSGAADGVLASRADRPRACTTRPAHRFDPRALDRLASVHAVEPSDAQLLESWRGGAEDAGEELFRRHFPAIARFFRGKVHGDIEELIQATFLGCIEGHARLRDAESFRGFLFGLARNVLFNYYRRRHVRGDAVDIAECSLHDLGPTASSLVGRDERQRLLLAALVRLPLAHQLVIEFAYWEEMTLAEIATAMDVPVGTAATRLRRAKQLLEEQMTQLADSPALRASISGGFETWARALRDER